MYKEIIKLKYIEDLTISQISKKINQPINTVKIKIRVSHQAATQDISTL